tara:strand:- start:4692 stop:5897 length:1206 start_codon:yes stop_codon:yes gene_type:complete
MIALDLFCGAGGLSCGLEMAGFSTILANEIVPIYAETYKNNHPDTEVVVDDIRAICDRNLKKSLNLKVGELDLLAGGPPCQGFSINAPIRSLDDARNHLFKDFLRVAKSLKPKAILIENVPGIVSMGKGTVVSEIYRELQSMGYSVTHRILFAGHYGVPQMRFRTVFIAIKGKNQNIAFPKPEYNASAIANFTGAKELCIKVPPILVNSLKPHTSVWDAISDLPPIFPNNQKQIGIYDYPSPPDSTYQKMLRKNSRLITNHHSARLGKINLERLEHIPQGGSWRDIPVELLPDGLKRARRSDHTKRYGRLHPDNLCSTVLTKCDPHWGSFFHPTQNRVISVREAARIQSFPDKYTFSGSVTQQYEQVGNAVPPLMAKAIGDTIAKLIEQTSTFEQRRAATV